MRVALRVVAVSCMLILLTASAPGQRGGNPNPGIVPPNSTAHGMTYGEWAGAWWNWALQYPLGQSPLFDPDGTLTMQGQGGPVFFLAGTLGGSAERRVTIDPGKSVFFSVANYLGWYPEVAATEAALRERAHTRIDAFGLPGASILCTVDGREVEAIWSYRAESPPGGFALNVARGSLLNQWGYAPGVREPAVTDGYWLMLTPPAPGQHAIHFASWRPGFALDVLYHITVLPPGRR